MKASKHIQCSKEKVLVLIWDSEKFCVHTQWIQSYFRFHEYFVFTRESSSYLQFIQIFICFAHNVLHKWRAMIIRVHLATKYKGQSLSLQCYYFYLHAIPFLCLIQTRPSLGLYLKYCSTSWLRWSVNLHCNGCSQLKPLHLGSVSKIKWKSINQSIRSVIAPKSCQDTK